MLRGDLIDILRNISTDFRFYAPVDQYTNASLWINTRGGQEHEMICALPAHYVPEYTVLSRSEIKARGWRDILKIVLNKKLESGKPAVDKHKFWKVLHKHGIWNIDRAVLWESNDEKKW